MLCIFIGKLHSLENLKTRICKHSVVIYFFFVSFFFPRETPESNFALEKKRKNTKETHKRRKKETSRSKLRQSALHIHSKTAFIRKLRSTNMQSTIFLSFFFVFLLRNNASLEFRSLPRKKKKHQKQKTKKKQLQSTLAQLGSFLSFDFLILLWFVFLFVCFLSVFHITNCFRFSNE